MTYETSKLKEVIEIFDGLVTRSLDIYSPCIEKALIELWDLYGIDKYKNQFVSYMLSVLDDVYDEGRDSANEAWRFYYKFSKNNGGIEYVAPKMKDESTEEIKITENDIYYFANEKNLWQLLEDVDSDTIPKEIVALYATKKLIDSLQFEQDFNEDENLEEIAQSDKTIRNKLEVHPPLTNLLIKYIYYCRPDLATWKSSFLEVINQNAFAKLIESILKAEFFELDDYSQRLSEVLLKHGNIASDDPEMPVIPYTYYSLRNILRHIIEKCHITREMFSIDNCNKVWIDAGNSVDRVTITKTEIGKGETVFYERLAWGVCDLTDIDLTYVTSIENIKTLIWIINLVDGRSNIFEFSPGQIPSTYVKLFEIIKVKASVLLDGMINHPMQDRALEVKYFVGDENARIVAALTVQTACETRRILQDNKYLEFWSNHKGKSFSINSIYDWLNEDIDSSPSRDIMLYNKFIKHGINVDSRISTVIRDMNSPINDTESFVRIALEIDNISQQIGTVTSSFLYRAILFMFEHIEKWRDNQTERKLNFLSLTSKLLGQLRDYLDSYSSGTKPRFSFRPTFQNCFYTINKGVLNFTPSSKADSFFFASLYFRPFNPLYLERFYTKYQTLFTNYNQDYFSTISSHIKQELSDNLNKELLNERRGTVQILGIFAALLAFVSMSIGMVKLAKNPMEFTLFCCAFGGALLLLVLAIQAIIGKHELPEEHRRKKLHEKVYHSISIIEWKLISGLTIIVLICIILSFFVKWGTHNEDLSPTIQTETSIFNNSLELQHIQMENPTKDSI